MLVGCPVVEADRADEFSLFIEPICGRDTQSAGDLVVAVSSSQGSAVSGHTIGDFFPVHRPLNTHMVRVEFTGHTNDGLLLFVFLVSTLFS